MTVEIFHNGTTAPLRIRRCGNNLCARLYHERNQLIDRVDDKANPRTDSRS